MSGAAIIVKNSENSHHLILIILKIISSVLELGVGPTYDMILLVAIVQQRKSLVLILVKLRQNFD